MKFLIKGIIGILLLQMTACNSTNYEFSTEELFNKFWEDRLKNYDVTYVSVLQDFFPNDNTQVFSFVNQTHEKVNFDNSYLQYDSVMDINVNDLSKNAEVFKNAESVTITRDLGVYDFITRESSNLEYNSNIIACEQTTNNVNSSFDYCNEKEIDYSKSDSSEYYTLLDRMIGFFRTIDYDPVTGVTKTEDASYFDLIKVDEGYELNSEMILSDEEEIGYHNNTLFFNNDGEWIRQETESFKIMENRIRYFTVIIFNNEFYENINADEIYLPFRTNDDESRKNLNDYINRLGVSIDGTIEINEIPLLHNNKETDINSDNNVNIEAGRYFSIVLDGDFISATGDNRYNQISINGWNELTEISAGGYHTLGLYDNGNVIGTGYNTSGQLDVNTWENISTISAGRYHSLGLDIYGNVYCVGENKYAQCDVNDWNNILDISAGRYNSYAIINGGDVISTPSNDYGQADIDDWRDVVEISAGTYHVLGLTTDGKVLCAGGQDDSVCNTESWENIVAISAGGYHSLGLDIAGNVYAVGNNDVGQLDVREWKNIVDISGGRLHTIGIDEDGNIYGVGSNEYGQLDLR